MDWDKINQAIDFKLSERQKEYARNVVEAGMDKRITALNCPLCDSDQVQICVDGNNRSKDFAKCRQCKCQAPLSIWNKPR